MPLRPAKACCARKRAKGLSQGGFWVQGPWAKFGERQECRGIALWLGRCGVKGGSVHGLHGGGKGLQPWVAMWPGRQAGNKKAGTN